MQNGSQSFFRKVSCYSKNMGDEFWRLCYCTFRKCTQRINRLFIYCHRVSFRWRTCWTKREISTTILHFGLKTLYDSTFRLESYLQTHKPKLVGFSLHWHYQIADVLEIARHVREVLPKCTIVFGGFTASVFYKELLDKFSFIDAVVRGDGEEPLVQLAQCVCRDKGSFDSIPNLCWRNNGSVQINPMGYCGSTENLSKVNHTRIDLLENAEDYFSKYLFLDEEIYNLHRCFYYTPGRGCPMACSICGGGSLAHKRYFDRSSYFLFDHDKVVKDLQTLWDHGIDSLRICYDPAPQSDYYAELFDKLRSKGMNFRMIFEAWDLPTDRFLSSFASTFTSDSLIILSPECGSEIVRKKNKGFSFTNDDLLDALERIHSHKIETSLFFSYGLPFETRDDLPLTLDLVQRCQQKGAACRAMPMYLDPCSPVFLFSERYGVELELHTMEDFIEEHQQHSQRVNYRTKHLTKREILEGLETIGELCQESPKSTNQAKKEMSRKNDIELQDRPDAQTNFDAIRRFKQILERDLQKEKQRFRLFGQLIKALGPLFSGRKAFSNGFHFSRISKSSESRIRVEWIREKQRIVTYFVLPDYDGPTFLRNHWMGLYLHNPERRPEIELAFREIEPELKELLSSISEEERAIQ